MKLFFLTTLCTIIVCMSSSVDAALSNSGVLQLKHVSLGVNGTLNNTGELIGIDAIDLTCDTLTGDGLIKSPQIKIETSIFAFTGIIDCTGQCTIVTGQPFDESMFTRIGEGDFNFVLLNEI
jgi:hypothetical protein